MHYNDIIMSVMVSNHGGLHCLLNCWFRCRSKKTSKLHVTGLYAGDSPVTGEFPAQKASNMENVSIWWRHYVDAIICIHISSCVMLTPMCTLKSLILIAIGIYKPFTVSALKSNCGINGIINDKIKMLTWQQVSCGLKPRNDVDHKLVMYHNLLIRQ